MYNIESTEVEASEPPRHVSTISTQVDSQFYKIDYMLLATGAWDAGSGDVRLTCQGCRWLVSQTKSRCQHHYFTLSSSHQPKTKHPQGSLLNSITQSSILHSLKQLYSPVSSVLQGSPRRNMTVGHARPLGGRVMSATSSVQRPTTSA